MMERAQASWADRPGLTLASNLITEAEDIKKRWQEYTEELYKKDLHDQDNHSVITHLEPDILECEVKWALESITTSSAFRTPTAGSLQSWDRRVRPRLV